jgi:hypothetical protein
VHATPIVVSDWSTDIEPDVSMSGEHGLHSTDARDIMIAIVMNQLREALGDNVRDELVIFASKSIPFGENFPLGIDLALLSAPGPVPEASSLLLFGSGVVIVAVIARRKRRK